MTDLEYLLDFVKQFHDGIDIADILDIAQDIKQLDRLYQQGNQYAIIQFVQKVVNKHKAEADEHDKGQPPAQDIHQLYYSCRDFLARLGKNKIEKKAKEKLAEEALKHLGGN